MVLYWLMGVIAASVRAIRRSRVASVTRWLLGQSGADSALINLGHTGGHGPAHQGGELGQRLGLVSLGRLDLSRQVGNLLAGGDVGTQQTLSFAHALNHPAPSLSLRTVLGTGGTPSGHPGMVARRPCLRMGGIAAAGAGTFRVRGL